MFFINFFFLACFITIYKRRGVFIPFFIAFIESHLNKKPLNWENGFFNVFKKCYLDPPLHFPLWPFFCLGKIPENGPQNVHKFPGISRDLCTFLEFSDSQKSKATGFFVKRQKNAIIPGFSGISGYFLGFPEFFLKGQKGRGFSLKRKKPTKKGPT